MSNILNVHPFGKDIAIAILQNDIVAHNSNFNQ